MLKGSMRRGMSGGILKANGSLSSADNSLTHRSQFNRYPSSAPGSKPLDGISVRATSGVDSSAGTEMPDGLLGMNSLAGNGTTTAASELKRK
jgi:hypothetical protein